MVVTWLTLGRARLLINVTNLCLPNFHQEAIKVREQAVATVIPAYKCSDNKQMKNHSNTKKVSFCSKSHLNTPCC
ncbi:hypothetical protein QVD17_00746 [Tagetes erecta]|uniref:Uncharacterized protein n=1 Tax=Tagetes erecta TaxID=13708 RepID=A0AAD8L9D4_TARER|nr:hypothetical protein QVD17_00746 [Tagetes erecta]